MNQRRMRSTNTTGSSRPGDPEKETPPRAPPDLPDTTANAEKPKELPGAEIILERETEPEQQEEHNQPVDRPTVTRPRLERHQSSYLI